MGHFLGDLDDHPEQRRAVGFPLRVCSERERAAAVERLMQDKVERVQIGQFVSFNFAQANPGEVLLYPLRRDLANQGWVVLRLEGDQADVGYVAFVTRARMCDLE